MSPQFTEAVEAFQSGELDRARSLAEAELSQAESAQTRHLLGLVHCRLGDPATGAEHLRLAAEAEPDNTAFRVMLVRALADAGRPSEIVEMADPPEIRTASALELWRLRGEAADALGNHRLATDAWSRVATAAPGDWRAWANLGNSLAAEERWSEAADALSRAAAINPAELPIRRNAASALLRADRLADALPHLRTVATTQPDDAESHSLLACTLAALGEHDEAIAEFEAAERVGAGTVTTALGMGQSLIAKQRFAEAEAPLARAYALDPVNRSTISAYGLVLERNNKVDEFSALLRGALENGVGKEEMNYLWALLARREGRLEEAHELLLQTAPEDGDPVSWYHLRAKIADGLGNAEEAFEAAAAMNRAALEQAVPPNDREAWRRQAIDYRREQHALARAITPEWAARVPLLKVPSPRRVSFLVGFPRSGTTLLDTFLMGHPDVAVLEEEQLVGKAGLGVKVRDLPTASTDFVRKARATYLENLAAKVGSEFAGLSVDKFPLDMAAAPLIQAMFPGAPIIFAQRHPCDVVLSGFMQTFGMVNFGTVEDAADYYDAMMRTWTAARDAMGLNTHTVVYEELVEDPERVLKEVIAFLGLDWDERLLDHRRTARERGTIATPSYSQVTQPISKSASGRWKRYRKQMEPALPILLPWAERLGYRD